MLFGKRRNKPGDEPESAGTVGEEVVDSAKTLHGRFTIIPRAKQLVNGNWIARATLEEETGAGARSYDLSGPMNEFASKEDAVRGGIEYAKRRLDDGF